MGMHAGHTNSIQPLSMDKRKESTNNELSIGYGDSDDDNDDDKDDDDDVIAQHISAWGSLYTRGKRTVRKEGKKGVSANEIKKN
jgi:hypothetical protein